MGKWLLSGLLIATAVELSIAQVTRQQQEYKCCCDTHPLTGASSSQFRAFPHKNNKVWYMFIDCPLTWIEAERFCRTKMVVNGRPVRGHLIDFEDQSESNFMNYIIDRHTGGDQYGLWIGLYRTNTCSHDWKWVGIRRQSSFRSWYTAPSHCGPVPELCAHLYDNQQWMAAECTNRFRAICKYEQVSDFSIGVGTSSLSNRRP